MTWDDSLTNSQLAFVILFPLGLLMLAVALRRRRKRSWSERYNKVYGKIKAPLQPEAKIMSDWKGWKREV